MSETCTTCTTARHALDRASALLDQGRVADALRVLRFALVVTEADLVLPGVPWVGS